MSWSLPEKSSIVARWPCRRPNTRSRISYVRVIAKTIRLRIKRIIQSLVLYEFDNQDMWCKWWVHRRIENGADVIISLCWTLGWVRDVGHSRRDDPTGLVLDRDRPRSENIVCPNPLQASFGLDPKNYMWKQPFLQLLFHKYPTTSGLVNVAGF